ncbi:MAG TPA: DUF2182 domain-containing protein [Caulobacteraceae bacterium]|jgi:predicted metal-binding membrane protein|nr:DUF2182 domain-containing protein [Caulobacteraceae bacterium]
MTPAGRDRLRVWSPLLAISGAAWALLAVWPGGMAMPGLCAASASWAASLGSASLASLRLALLIDPPARIAAGWALMLAAMMTPLLAAPVRHLRERSFAGRRARAITLFVAGYGAVWMAAAAALLALALLLRLVGGGPWPVLALAFALALIWQASPAKQRCLNRCHALPELPAFGWAADRAALGFGLTHGGWCVGGCWALMLVPLLAPGAHLAAMAGVALWLLAERLDRPAPARWRLRTPAKALRLVAARARKAAAIRPLLPRRVS